MTRENMSEKQKMLAGLQYNSEYDPQLIKDREIAKELLADYNSTRPSNYALRTQIIKKLFSSIGDGFTIEQPFYCDYGYNIEVGEHLYTNFDCVILDCAKVTIGDYVMFGPGVKLCTAGHPLEAKGRISGLEFSKPITIGNHVWLGANVIVLPGVTIGNGAVVGAGSIVTKDIPPHTVAVGNPCKVVKKLHNNDVENPVEKV